MTGNSSGASSLMKSVREDVVMSTYSVAMIAVTVLMLGNMSRNLHLGNPLSIPHSVLYLAFLATYVLRHRIGARWLAPILLVALYLAGTFGYFIYGFILLWATRRADCRHCLRGDDGRGGGPCHVGTPGVWL
jgi:hypothetical protein